MADTPQGKSNKPVQRPISRLTSSPELFLKAKAVYNEVQMNRIMRRLAKSKRQAMKNASPDSFFAKSPEMRQYELLYKNFRLVRDLSYRDQRYLKPYGRSIHLARMFLKGVPLHEVEQKCYSRPKWKEVEALVIEHCDLSVLPERFHNYGIKQLLEDWKAGENLVFGPGKIDTAERRVKRSKEEWLAIRETYLANQKKKKAQPFRSVH